MMQMKIIDSFTFTLIKIVERNAPLKKRFVRGNQFPFINKELRKAMYTRNSLRNNSVRSLPKKMEKVQNKTKQICVS